MNIQPVGFVDVWHMSAKLCAAYRTRFGDDGDGHSEILLRTSVEEEPLLKEWKSAKQLLARIRHASAPFFGSKPLEYGRVWLDSLKPSSFVPWEADETPYAEEHLRLVICLVPCPNSWTYSGGEAMVLPVGQVNVVNVRMLTSQINFGPVTRIHLNLDMKRPEADK